MRERHSQFGTEETGEGAFTHSHIGCEGAERARIGGVGVQAGTDFRECLIVGLGQLYRLLRRGMQLIKQNSVKSLSLGTGGYGMGGAMEQQLPEKVRDDQNGGRVKSERVV